MTNIRIKLSNQELISCCFSDDGKLLTSGGSNGSLYLVENRFYLKFSKILKIHNASINRIIFKKNNIYTASSDKTCKIWDPETFQILRIFNLENEKPFNMDFFDNLIITSGNKGNIRLWDQRIRFSIGNFFQGFPVLSANFLKDSRKVVSCGISPNLFLWDLRKFNEKCLLFSLIGHKSSVSSLCLTNDNSFVFSMDFTSLVYRWMFELSKNLIKRYFMKPGKIFSKTEKANFCKISCDSLGKIFAHGGPCGFVYFRNQKKGNIMLKIQPHGWGAVNEVIFHPSNRIFCSCGEDGFLVVKNFL